MTHQPVPIVDAAGRGWLVYEFSVIAGKVIHFAVGSGSGQYRGFDPVDGGARRRLMMLGAVTRRPVTAELLLEQLAAAQLDYRDDPEKARIAGRSPERLDPPL